VQSAERKVQNEVQNNRLEVALCALPFALYVQAAFSAACWHRDGWGRSTTLATASDRDNHCVGLTCAGRTDPLAA
jgi:hypothetical protein